MRQRMDGAAWAAVFEQTRRRTGRIFDLVAPEAFYQRPIPLRHPFAFYAGHVAAFNGNLLFRRLLGQAAFQPEFDALFARGVDPEDEAAVGIEAAWPERVAIDRYAGALQQRLVDWLREADLARPPHADLKHGWVLHLLLEHELMHQETLMYLVHQLPRHWQRPPAGLRSPDVGPAPAPRSVVVPAGLATLGADDGEYAFVWDNERAAQTVVVPAFAIDVDDVTNGQFLSFVEAGGYWRSEYWTDEGWAWRERQRIEHPFFWQRRHGDWWLRDLFADRPLPLSWPVRVTHAEASAYARFVGKRLPTEAEWHRAAYGDRRQRYPWGDTVNGVTGNVGFSHWSPLPVGTSGAVSPWGVRDLWGNGWEWTSTAFAPFVGFAPYPGYPGYSADFFDGRHYVLKGGSLHTDPRLLRRSFRNWFFGHYPYLDATFRCVEV